MPLSLSRTTTTPTPTCRVQHQAFTQHTTPQAQIFYSAESAWFEFPILLNGGGYRHSRYHPLAKKHLTGAASQLCTVLCSQIQIWGRLYLYFYGSSHSLSTDTSLSHISLELSESVLVTDCREIRGGKIKGL